MSQIKVFRRVELSLPDDGTIYSLGDHADMIGKARLLGAPDTAKVNLGGDFGQRNKWEVEWEEPEEDEDETAEDKVINGCTWPDVQFV